MNESILSFKNLRRVLVIAAIVVGVVLLSRSSYCDFETAPDNRPVDIVTAAVKAIESRQPEKVTRYYTPAPAGYLGRRLQDLYNRCDEITVTNINAVLISEIGNIAHVLVSYDITFHIYDQYTHNYIETDVQVVKTNDRWLINEII